MNGERTLIVGTFLGLGQDGGNLGRSGQRTTSFYAVAGFRFDSFSILAFEVSLPYILCIWGYGNVLQIYASGHLATWRKSSDPYSEIKRRLGVKCRSPSVTAPTNMRGLAGTIAPLA